jgi:glyoxylase I family protein
MEGDRGAGATTQLTQMTPSGPHHFAIKVRDLPTVERFYRDVLGLSVLRRWPATIGEGDRSVWLDTGDGAGTFLALETLAGEQPTGGASVEARSGDTAAPADEPGHHLLALRIARNQRGPWEARLAAAGVTISSRTEYTIYFTDPEGNRLGLSHHPDPRESP